MNDWTSQCENAKFLLQDQDHEVNDRPIDVADGSSAESKSKIDKKSPKLFHVVSRLVLRTTHTNGSSPEKK